MSSLLTLAQYCQKAYDPMPDGFWDQVFKADGVTLCVKQGQDGLMTLCFPGSEKMLDWLRDADAMPVRDGRLGVVVHAGAMRGLGHVVDMAAGLLRAAKAVEVTGHSLGGMHAVLATALIGKMGLQVEMLAAFEPAKVGFEGLAALVQAAAKQVVVTRNGEDPVPELPATVEGLPWQHPVAVTRMSCQDGVLEGVEDHMIGRVITAVGALKAV